MDLNSKGVYVSIVMMADTHSWIHPHRGSTYFMKLNIWESSAITSPSWCHTMGGWVMQPNVFVTVRCLATLAMVVAKVI